MTQPLLIAKNICKSFSIESPANSKDSNQKLEILCNINLEVYPGQTIAITGASGEGKSTLLQILGLLDVPSSGQVIFPKWPGLSPEQIRLKHIGFIFQQFFLLEDLTALENVVLPLRLTGHGLATAAMYEQAKAGLERVGLGHRIHHPASRLSGGEKQRCAIARALIRRPSILMADEPTGNLDHDNAEQVADLLFEIARSYEGCLILITHETKIAKRADCVLQLNRAKLQSLVES